MIKKRFLGQVGKLKRDKIREYCELHNNVWPEVQSMIYKCNIKNYSIFIEGDTVFSYFEYEGDDYQRDMDYMAADKMTQLWWKHTHPCFERYAINEESEFYHDMKQIFYLE